MYEKVIVPIISFIAISLLTWFGIRVRAWWDRRKVYQWLKSNTENKPGETHAETIVIAKGVRLEEDKVKKACAIHEKIFRYSDLNGKEQWSVWRQEPQSSYEGMTKEEIEKHMSF